MPRFHKIKGHFRIAALRQRLAIEPNAGTRIVRRQADHNRVAHSVRLHLLQSLQDKWVPVPHANINRHSNLLGKQCCLFQRKVCERRLTDRVVPMAHLFHNLLRQRPSSGDMQQELRHIVDRVRTSVRQQQYRVFAPVGHCHRHEFPPSRTEREKDGAPGNTAVFPELLTASSPPPS